MKTDQTDAIIKDNSIEEVKQIKGKPMTFKTCKDVNLHSKESMNRQKTIKSSMDHPTGNVTKFEVFQKLDDARNSANVVIQVEDFSEANNTLKQNTIIEHIKSNIKQERSKMLGKSKSRVDSYKSNNNINKKKQLEQKKKINEMYTFHSKWRSKSKTSSNFKGESKKRETTKKNNKNRDEHYKLDKQANKSPTFRAKVDLQAKQKEQERISNINKQQNKKLNIKQPSSNIDKASFLDRMEKGLTNDPAIFNIQNKHKEESKRCAYKNTKKEKSKSGKSSRYNISHNSSRRCNN